MKKYSFKSFIAYIKIVNGKAYRLFYRSAITLPKTKLIKGNTITIGTDDPVEITNMCTQIGNVFDTDVFPVANSVSAFVTETLNLAINDIILNTSNGLNTGYIKVDCIVLNGTENAGIPACMLTYSDGTNRSISISDYYPIDTAIEWFYPEPVVVIPPDPPYVPPAPHETPNYLVEAHNDVTANYGFNGVGYGFDYVGQQSTLYNGDGKWMSVHSAYIAANGDFVIELRKEFGDDGVLITDQNYFANVIVNLQTSPGVYEPHQLQVVNSVYTTGETGYNAQKGIWTWSNPGFTLVPADEFKLTFAFVA